MYRFLYLKFYYLFGYFLIAHLKKVIGDPDPDPDHEPMPGWD